MSHCFPWASPQNLLIPIPNTDIQTAYLLLIVIVCYFSPPKGMEPPGEIHLIHFTPNFISTFPVQVFAFTCAQNVRRFFKYSIAFTNDEISAIPNLQRIIRQYSEADEYRDWERNWISGYDIRGHCGVRLLDLWLKSWRFTP